MNLAAAVAVGYLLDGYLGDPPWLPHPVRGIGWLVAAGERRWNRGGPDRRRLLGSLLTLLVTVGSGVAAWALVAAAAWLHPWLATLVTTAGVAVLLARHSLAAEAGTNVFRPLAMGNLTAARAAVSRVVGRDTADLSAAEVARAAVETIAENLSDGVAAPLLFALAFGLPGIAVYKAINTLDSMIGHRDQRYLHFGRLAARLDDVANWLPARLSCLALTTAAGLSGRRAAGAWLAARADARHHASPNAGWPEAAMAGALGLRLGGVNHYDGEPHFGPVLNAGGRPTGPTDIPAAVQLMHRTSHLLLAGGILVRILVLDF